VDSPNRLALEAADVTRMTPPPGLEAAIAALDRASAEHVERVLRWLVPDDPTRAVLRKLVG
jgi:hypothetical protein